MTAIVLEHRSCFYFIFFNSLLFKYNNILSPVLNNCYNFFIGLFQNIFHGYLCMFNNLKVETFQTLCNIKSIRKLFTEQS